MNLTVATVPELQHFKAPGLMNAHAFAVCTRDLDRIKLIKVSRPAPKIGAGRDEDLVILKEHNRREGRVALLYGASLIPSLPAPQIFIAYSMKSRLFVL